MLGIILKTLPLHSFKNDALFLEQLKLLPTMLIANVLCDIV